jgi:hypothetical protein
MSVGLTGCTQEITPQRAEVLLAKSHSHRFSTAHFACKGGERGWDFVCDARHEPTPISAKQGVKPTVQRVGIVRIGTHLGEPAFSLAVLPDSGPLPSREEFASPEWVARRRAEADAHAANVRQRSDRAVGKK